MSKPFPLQTLLDLAHTHSDSAAAQLGILNKHNREMEERLQLLLEYRREYTANLTRMATGGISSVDWCNFREFIEKIDAAIVQQNQAVEQARNNVLAGQHHWHAQQRKVKSFDTLAERHRQVELKRESVQEQKEQDEFALRSFHGRRLAMG